MLEILHDFPICPDLEKKNQLEGTFEFLYRKPSTMNLAFDCMYFLEPCPWSSNLSLMLITHYSNSLPEEIKFLFIHLKITYIVNKRCRFLLDFEKEVKNGISDFNMKDHPFGGQDINASSLGWAMSAVSSRAFRLYGKKSLAGAYSDVPMMLPLIDMCNHSFDPNARIVQEQGEEQPEMLVKGFDLVSNLVFGDQSFPTLLNYGCLSNDLFLLDYGFVIPSNRYDTIELKYDGALLDAASLAAGVSSPNFSSPAPWQQEILSQLNLYGGTPDLKVTLGGPDLVEGRLLAALRVLLESESESVQKHDLSTLKSISAEAPCGIATEVAAFRTIIALCVIALEHFPTKIMEDESMLKKGVPDTTKLAITFRIQKKSLIVDVMRDLLRRIKSLKETVSAKG
ncbi:hypothetical protein ACJRO7_012057 [Eucalyptus globulus]|uniref:Rubisco LSMT substrate-binding domain-containing protein n=1 Tax=Eucalyptus globulus TaxID=34317 RepID=A0ABD3LMX0_EUCGL